MLDNAIRTKLACADSFMVIRYRKICVKRPLSKRSNIGFQDQLSLYAGQKEHSTIISTSIKLPIGIKISVFSFLSGRFTQVLLNLY